MSTYRRRCLIGFFVCLGLLVFLLVVLVHSASAESLTGKKSPYRYCFDIFSNRPAVCVDVPNRAGRFIDCRLFLSCQPRVGG
jgi:hypothetical protein